MSEFLNQLFVELIKLFISGILGGLVGSYLSLKNYKFQKRADAQFESRVKKREALADLILILPWIHRDIVTNWENPMDEKQTPQEHMFDLVNRLNYWKILFLDDSSITNELQKLHSLLGASKESFYGKDKTFNQYPSEILSEIEEAAKKKIVELNKF